MSVIVAHCGISDLVHTDFKGGGGAFGGNKMWVQERS